MLTHKHFSSLAELVRDFGAVDANDERCYKRLAERLGDFCENENPRFDRVRFNEACGLKLDRVGLWLIA